MILLVLKASSSLQDSHEAIWPNADQNFRGKIVLQFISNNTRLFSGLCRSSTECKSNTDPDNILYTATLNRPHNYKFYSLETTPTGFYTRKRKEQCRDQCERKCKGWSGCVAFSSTIHDEYSSKCECYGWKTLPNFGPTENSIDKAAHLSGWCVTGWFEGEMTY